MMPIEKEDWTELIQILTTVGGNLSSSNGSFASIETFKESLKMLQSFHTTAAMLGLKELEQAGLLLEKYLAREVGEAQNADALAGFGFAVDTLLTGMKQTSENAYGNALFLAEIAEILDVPLEPEVNAAVPAREAAPAADGISAGSTKETETVSDEGEAARDAASIEAILGENGEPPLLDFAKLQRIVASLGGELRVEPGSGQHGAGTFELRFDARPAILERVQTVLSPFDEGNIFASQLDQHDNRLNKVLLAIKQFMMALSAGDIFKAHEALTPLVEKHHDAGLFVEIGTLARDLHNSLKSFIQSFDPALKDMVEDKLPDSGSRLEHILQLTEQAATTTLDHVEKMQKRNQDDEANLDRLRDVFAHLQALGDTAQERLTTGHKLVDELRVAAALTRDDLITILTAQDYQDLTGQVILKIINLLNDLQLKMVNLIRTFGDSIEERKKTEKDELYGPAHKGKIESLHSQDDVDQLLAEFGF